MNSASVDLIYLDPPFNSKANYAAPTGSKAAGAAFKDTWTLSDVDVEWISLIETKHPGLFNVLLAAMTDSDKSYLVYMAVRLLEMHRILKLTGSIYLHCDSTMSHYLKLVLDAIFGRKNFRNEIVWQRDIAGKGAKRVSHQWPNLNESILMYSRTDEWKFEQAYTNLTEEQKTPYRYKENSTRRLYKAVQLGDYSVDSIKKMKEQGLIHTSSSGKEYKKYYLDEAKNTVGNIWTDIRGFGTRTAAKERIGYPTQKPLALLQRIIQASSSKGDMILDPFCGCATACIAAEKLQRQWVGIDISPKAGEIVKQRMDNERELFFQGTHRTDQPERTDLGQLIRYNHPDNKNFLYNKQDNRCMGCKQEFLPRNLEVDHIIAKKSGGTDHIENLQLLCGSCNRIKGNRRMEYLRARLQMAA